MTMKKLLLVLVTAVPCAPCLAADPDYQTIALEITIAKPAKDVWAKVGNYCDIREWLKVDCAIISGDGGMGSVRSLAGGRVVEVLVGQTELSYGYTQPAKTGEFYNLYHGFMEARPVTKTSSKIIYTLLLDESDKPDQAAKDADIARRRAMFEGALRTMKTIAEAK
jgi:hypothetical protein